MHPKINSLPDKENDGCFPEALRKWKQGFGKAFHGMTDSWNLSSR
jgi:hypothetical protein